MKKKPISEYPHMMAQWHPTKNPQFDVNTTAAGLRETAWWLCPKCGYEWEALIDTRKASKGLCPNCEKDQRGPKTAKTIAMVPHLIDYWDYDANPDLDPHTLTATKNMYANWKCPKCGHKWSANIHSRYYDNTACPACAGKVVTVTKNVVTEYPEVEKYYDKDVKGNPELWTLSKASRTMVHWRCPDCGHTWVQSVADRIRDGKVRGCAACTGAKPVDTYENEFPELAKMYSLDNEVPFSELRSKDRHTKYLWTCPEGHSFESTLGSMMLLIEKPHKGCPVCLGKRVAQSGKSAADLYPELLKEVNDDTDLSKLLPNSKKDINWKCQECGYEWNATVAVRTGGFGKCPVCNNIRPVKGYNTVHDLFYDIAKQWAPSNEKQPDELMPTSNEWVKVICPDCGLEHSVQVKEATAGNIKCPYCSGAKAISGVNSLKAVHPDWLRYWDYEKNTSDPDNILATATTDCYWVCDQGHHYSMKLSLRDAYIKEGRELCPYCDNRRTMREESLAVLYPEYMRFWDDEELPYGVSPESGAYLNWKCDKGHHYQLSPASFITCMEEGREPCPYCDERAPISGVNSLSALRPDLVEELAPENTIDPDAIFATYSQPLLWVCKEGHHYTRSPQLRLQDEAEGRESCPYCDERTPLPGINTLEALRPDLVKELAYENEVDPDTIFATYSYPLSWICKEGHHYSRSPQFRLQDEAEGRESCPYCNERLPVPGVNSLKALRPDWMEEFAPENEVDPDTVFETYSMPLRWICKEGHHYARSPQLRLQDEEEGRESCPYCDDRAVLPGYNSFAARHPDLLEEWDYINNYVLADPDQISEGSNERVWWKCMKNPDHDEYIMSVTTRVLFKLRDRNPCPVCKGRRRKRQLFVPYKKK